MTLHSPNHRRARIPCRRDWRLYLLSPQSSAPASLLYSGSSLHLPSPSHPIYIPYLISLLPLYYLLIPSTSQWPSIQDSARRVPKPVYPPSKPSPSPHGPNKPHPPCRTSPSPNQPQMLHPNRLPQSAPPCAEPPQPCPSRWTINPRPHPRE